MPYGKNAKFFHKRQQKPDQFIGNTFRTVPLSHTDYSGEKYKKWKKKDSGAKAVVARKKKTKKWGIQSILIPKKQHKKNRSKNTPHLGKGWKEVKTKSHMEIPKKARGKKGFPTTTLNNGKYTHTYTYQKKRKNKSKY